MKLSLALSAVLCYASALNIILNNDDGFATANIRALYKALKDAGHRVLLVAPVSNQSGKGGSITLATGNNLTTASDFDYVPKGAPTWGQDKTDPNIWYFDGTPATCTIFGLTHVAPKIWNSTTPDLLISGPNEGNNIGTFAYTGSGTIGAAYTAIAAGVPAIAVSAFDTAHRDFRSVNSTSDISVLAANATLALLSQLVSRRNSSSARLLPAGYGLNLNIPQVNASCTRPGYVLSRFSTAEGAPRWNFNETTGTAAFAGLPSSSGPQLCIHGGCDLPTEEQVLAGCAASVTVFTIDYNAPATEKTTEDVRGLLAPLVGKGGAGNGTTTTTVPTAGASVAKQLGWVLLAAVGGVVAIL